jgi:hypothetical protein
MARKALFIVLIVSLMAVPALAKQSVSPSKEKTHASASKEKAPAGQTGRIAVDFGARWNSMSDKERKSFLDGFYFGIYQMCTNAAFAPDAQNQAPAQQESEKRLRSCMAANVPFTDLAAVQGAMTDLYQDSANNHIPFNLMMGFAFEKIAGKPYDDDLAKLRQNVEARLKIDK